jgi:hypothetical protein
LGTLVPSLANNIASSKPEIRGAASSAFDTLIERVDNTLLVQYFTNIIASGNKKIQLFMLEKLIGKMEIILFSYISSNCP